MFFHTAPAFAQAAGAGECSEVICEPTGACSEIVYNAATTEAVRMNENVPGPARPSNCSATQAPPPPPPSTPTPTPAPTPIGSVFCSTCATQIPNHHTQIQNNTSSNFDQQQQWTITTFFREQLLPAMMMMANQLTTTGMFQVELIGTFLDAKHQLETERLFQQMTARAHKDYQPSEGMCTFGTMSRSLVMSDRRSNMAQIAYATRMMQRQTLNGDGVSAQGASSDKRSRMKTFTEQYCDPADNQNGLSTLCPTATPNPGRRNIDIDYTRNVESRLTLDINQIDVAGQTANARETPTDDEQDVWALSANLFANNLSPKSKPDTLGDASRNLVRESSAENYLNLRAIFAKRSVAQNSFAALVAMRTAGDPASAPYLKAVIRELGVDNEDEIERLVGENPSYFALMEVLTKKLYQTPVFYTELYDKPVNIERKGAALQAIGLMQDRDLYNSLIRQEAVLSVLLETQLSREMEKVVNVKGRINPAGGGR